MDIRQLVLDGTEQWPSVFCPLIDMSKMREEVRWSVRKSSSHHFTIIAQVVASIKHLLVLHVLSCFGCKVILVKKVGGGTRDLCGGFSQLGGTTKGYHVYICFLIYLNSFSMHRGATTFSLRVLSVSWHKQIYIRCGTYECEHVRWCKVIA